MGRATARNPADVAGCRRTWFDDEEGPLAATSPASDVGRITEPHAYLVGGGIASLAAAVFLIRDGGSAGSDIYVLEQLAVVGGSMDGAGSRSIEDFFSAYFFDTNFWCMWRTTFAFQNWHSAIELQRYLLRFIQEFPCLHTMAGVRHTRLN